LYGALGESLFALKEGDIDYPAPILSDGTLRFAAITAAFFQPDLPEILTLEEIENGLHPTRLRLLVELMKAMSKSGNVQVMATTHSPLILEWLNPDDYATTFVCERDESTGATNIIPLSDIPALLNLIQKQPISELFAEGWFEGVL
jgi:predicted ATPase